MKTEPLICSVADLWPNAFNRLQQRRRRFRLVVDQASTLRSGTGDAASQPDHPAEREVPLSVNVKKSRTPVRRAPAGFSAAACKQHYLRTVQSGKLLKKIISNGHAGNASL